MYIKKIVFLKFFITKIHIFYYFKEKVHFNYYYIYAYIDFILFKLKSIFSINISIFTYI